MFIHAFCLYMGGVERVNLHFTQVLLYFNIMCNYVLLCVNFFLSDANPCVLFPHTCWDFREKCRPLCTGELSLSLSHTHTHTHTHTHIHTHTHTHTHITHTCTHIFSLSLSLSLSLSPKEVKDGKFHKYDYGTKGNIIAYGTVRKTPSLFKFEIYLATPPSLALPITMCLN